MDFQCAVCAGHCVGRSRNLDNRYAGASDLLFSPAESQKVFPRPRPRRAVLAFVQSLQDCTRHCAANLSRARRVSRRLRRSLWPATATKPAGPGGSGRLIISFSAPRFHPLARPLALRPRLSGTAYQAAVAALAAIWVPSPVVKHRHHKRVSRWQVPPRRMCKRTCLAGRALQAGGLMDLGL